MTICRGKSGLSRGSSSCGSRQHVSIQVACPAGTKPVGLLHNHFHSHRPSPDDLHVARSRKIAVCIVHNGTVKCYRSKD